MANGHIPWRGKRGRATARKLPLAVSVSWLQARRCLVTVLNHLVAEKAASKCSYNETLLLLIRLLCLVLLLPKSRVKGLLFIQIMSPWLQTLHPYTMRVVCLHACLVFIIRSSSRHVASLNPLIGGVSRIWGRVSKDLTELLLLLLLLFLLLLLNKDAAFGHRCRPTLAHYIKCECVEVNFGSSAKKNNLWWNRVFGSTTTCW